MKYLTHTIIAGQVLKTTTLKSKGGCLTPSINTEGVYVMVCWNDLGRRRKTQPRKWLEKKQFNPQVGKNMGNISQRTLPSFPETEKRGREKCLALQDSVNVACNRDGASAPGYVHCLDLLPRAKNTPHLFPVISGSVGEESSFPPIILRA